MFLSYDPEFVLPPHTQNILPCHFQIFFCHSTCQNFLPPYLSKKFCYPTHKIFCHATSQNIFCCPTIKNILPPTQPQDFVTKSETFFCSPLPPPPPHEYVLGLVSIFMHDLSVLKRLCVEKCLKIHQNRLKLLWLASSKKLR